MPKFNKNKNQHNGQRRVSKNHFCFTLIIIGASFFVFEKLSAQAPGWIWTKAIEGVIANSGMAVGTSIVVDDMNGNVYSSGYFHGFMDFDPGPDTFNLNSEGNVDIYVSKLDSTGQFIWAKSIGGPGDASINAYAIAFDPNGFIYVTGDFHGAVDFDPGPGTFNLTSGVSFDAYLLKLNMNGNFVWVRKWGSTSGYSNCRSIVVNHSSDEIYCTGIFTGTVDFDPGPANFTLSPGDEDSYISKFDGAGIFQWAKQITGFGYAEANWMDIDQGRGDIYITGAYYNFIDFDPGPGSAFMDSQGDYDIFILKLDINGEFEWVRGMGASGSISKGQSLVYDPTGNGSVYFTGSLDGMVDMDPGGGTFFLSAGGFLCKLTSSGNFAWAKPIGDIPFDGGPTVAIDKLSLGDVYVTGMFEGTTDFDPGPDTFYLTSNGSTDIFISKLDSAGGFEWAKSSGGASSDVSTALDVSNFGYAHVTGYFYSPIIQFDTLTLTNSGPSNAFIAKLDRVYCSGIVTNTADSGTGSLRDAVSCISNGATITFSLPVMSQITLTTGEIVINKNLTIAGPGIYALTLSGNNTSRIFNLFPGKNLNLNNLSLKNTTAPTNGGAIYANGNLTLENMELQNNFENGLHKGLTLTSTGNLNIQGSVEIKN